MLVVGLAVCGVCIHTEFCPQFTQPDTPVSANCFLEVEANLPSSHENDDILTVVCVAISWCL